MKLNSLEMKDRQGVIMKRCKEIVDVCKAEMREMTEDEEKEFNACKEEMKELQNQLEELKKRLASYDEDMPKEEPEDNKQDEDKPEDKEEKNKEKKSKTKTMEKKFNLLKELRSAYETGKKVNLAEVRAYTVNDEGEDVVQTDIFDIWEPLRAKNVLVQAGAQYISGIKNNVQIPLMGAVSVHWAGETAEAQDGSGTFGSKMLSPKRITAKYPISLELLAQDSVGVEAAVRADIIKAVNAKIEETVLGDASGTTTQPAGLFYGKEKAVITSFSGITALEADIEDANVYGDCKYIVSPKAKGDLRAMAKSTKSTELVMQNGAIDGTEVFSTSHVKDKNIVYGDFSNLVIATWDNVTLDVVRDVQSVGNGQVTIVVNAFVDAALVREGALAYGTTQS